MQSTVQAAMYDDGDVFSAMLASRFIVDYGYINKVNGDGTVDITHAVKGVMMDGTELPETVTPEVEVLFPSGEEFALRWQLKAGDRVLLVGLRDYVPKVSAVDKAEPPKAFLHYERGNVKALPLCVFSSEARTRVEERGGGLAVKCDKLEVNGNDKQFVTWAELNSALSQFVTALSSALLGATYVNAGGTPTPLAWTAGTPPTSLDISAAKTKTVLTGG